MSEPSTPSTTPNPEKKAITDALREVLSILRGMLDSHGTHYTVTQYLAQSIALHGRMAAAMAQMQAAWTDMCRAAYQIKSDPDQALLDEAGAKMARLADEMKALSEKQAELATGLEQVVAKQTSSTMGSGPTASGS